MKNFGGKFFGFKLTEGEQVPADVNKGVATEQNNAVKGQLEHEEEGWRVGRGLKLFAGAVAEG